MRTISIIPMVAALLMAATFSANAQKAKSAACDMSGCMSRCASKQTGGQPRFCAQYCSKKVNDNPKCK
jgi:hypothetical protein